MYLISLVVVVPAARLLWAPATSGAGAAGTVPLRWRSMILPCLVSVVGGAVFYALIVQLPFVLTRAGLSAPALIGAVAAGMSVATAVGAAVFGRVARLSRRVLLPVEFALAGLGLLVVYASSSLPGIATGALVTGFATGLLLPSLLTWAVDGLEFSSRGRGTGLWTGALFIGEFLSPLAVAAFGAVAGGPAAGIAVLGVVAVAMAVGLCALPASGVRPGLVRGRGDRGADRLRLR
jgi:sugar phosphate permease